MKNNFNTQVCDYNLKMSFFETKKYIQKAWHNLTPPTKYDEKRLIEN